jgi:hypothetical protein
MVSASKRLEAAQAAIEETNRRLAEVSVQRNAALLKDDDETAIKLGAEIDTLRQAARAHGDKIKLLREAAAEEERARRAKEQEALIGRIEAKIEQRDKALEDAAAAIKQLAAASERAIKLGREIMAAWSWQAHDLPVALLTPLSIMTSISHESFRVSYHPRRYGGMDTDPLAGVMLPGAKCPRVEWLEQPDRVRSLLDAVGDASEFAKRFLRTGKSSSVVVETVLHQPIADGAPAPTNGGEGVQRTEAEQRRASLLDRMEELAKDVTPAGEAEYQRVVSAIAAVEAEITATKQMEQQRHAGS